MFSCRVLLTSLIVFNICFTVQAGSSVERVCSDVPLVFTQNKGQFDKGVAFTGQARDYTLFLDKEGITFCLSRRQKDDVEHFALKLRFMDANGNPEIHGLEPVKSRSNYLLGSNPAAWKRGVTNYKRVYWNELYDKIDLVCYGNDKNLEYDIVVKPGANPSQVRFSYDLGAGNPNALYINRQGELIIATPLGNVVAHKPVTYQIINKQKKIIHARYIILDEATNTFAFEVGQYDHSYDLIIDPILEYSTYLGGRYGDQVRAAAVDAQGYVYVAGLTGSSDFPTTPGSYSHDSRRSMFVAKLSPDGSRLEYATYFGGRLSGSEFVQGIAVDKQGSVYLVGNTHRSDFPTTPGAYDRSYNGSNNQWHGDGFVTKLSPDGSSLVYSTFVGGRGAEVLGKIAVDDEGCAYACFITNSDNFPTTEVAFDRTYNGGQGDFSDSAVVKLSPDGSELLYSTYLGGSIGEDSISVITVDQSGCACLAGTTSSPDFPVTDQAFDPDYNGGESDIFITKLNPSGSDLIFSTFLGGSLYDGWPQMILDASQRIYIAGQTRSTDFPVTANLADPGPNSNQNFCVSILSSDGTSLEHSVLLGGSGSDSPGGIALDSQKNIYVSGNTESANFPVTSDAFQSEYRGRSDLFLCKLNTSLSELSYSTFFGGSGQEACMELVMDADDNAVIAGLTGSTDFLPTTGAFDQNYNGPANPAQWVGDGFVIKFAMNIHSETGPVYNINSGRRYNRIKHAILEAVDGDEIVIAPGLYNERIELSGVDIILRSEDSNDPFFIGGTIIQATPSDPVVTMMDNSRACQVAGLTIRAGLLGIAGSATNAIIRNCRIMDNVTHGLELSDASSPLLESCLITGNGQTGITMLQGIGRQSEHCVPIIENCIIVDNGAANVVGGQPVIVDSLVSESGN